jgi:hypothetical protein
VLDLEQIDLTKTRRTITVSKPAELGDRQSLSKPAERRPQQIKNSAEQINLNNKFRREKPDKSDTKMIRINVIRRGGLAQSFTAIKQTARYKRELNLK